MTNNDPLGLLPIPPPEAMLGEHRLNTLIKLLVHVFYFFFVLLFFTFLFYITVFYISVLHYNIYTGFMNKATPTPIPKIDLPDQTPIPTPMPTPSPTPTSTPRFTPSANITVSKDTKRSQPMKRPIVHNNDCDSYVRYGDNSKLGC